MLRPILILLLVLLVGRGYSQHNLLLLKKGRRTIATYAKGSYIAFQLRETQWFKGMITRIANDSIYLTEEIVRYGGFGGNDTTHYSGYHFAFSDIYALPRPGFQIDYLDGHWQINKAAGHVHFYWIKGGWLFRAASASYIALDLLNGAIHNDFSFQKEKTVLGIAAGVFLVGVLLKYTYQYRYRLGGKYHLETLEIP